MIYFENSQDKLPVTYKIKRLVRLSVEAALAYEGYRNSCEVSVSFTDDEGIRRLNRNFRKIDSATDVLSFPLFDFDGGEEPAVDELENMLGDIVISLERAKQQAEEFGHSFEREVAFLCVHSMLHLLGYDHVNSEDEELDMRRRQTAIMEMLGLAVK
ncbi:MAG: rRNA maturation RNase YbeY [Ruminococcaceae bacterium]|nr:rRNA maturation RNase YbeY [Oscillospiraceae bacterium]